MSSGKNNAMGLLLIVALVAIAAFAYNGGLLSMVPVSNCNTAVSNMNCASETGGTVTSLSQVTIASNYPGLNGQVWLANFVLNGGGQYLFGSSSSTIAKAINPNATSTNNQNIQITAKLNSQKLVIPYSGSGQQLINLVSEPVNFNFGWFSQGAGLFTICSQTNQTSNNPSYTVGCSGSAANVDMLAALQGYESTCQGGGGNAFLVSSGAATIGGLTLANAYQVECLMTGQATVGTVYSAGSPMVSENVSVIYTNGTLTHTFYLTSQIPQASYNNELSAQIYGYDVGALNTYIGTTSPSLVSEPSGAIFFLPSISTASIQSLDSLPSTALQSAGLNFNNVPITGIYSVSAFTSAITQQNTQISNLLSSTLQPTSPFANIQAQGYYASKADEPDANTGAPFVGVVTVTSNPVLQPEIQFISTAASLGIEIPVAYPKLLSVTPNPLIIQSGASATGTFTVSNNASVAGAAYIVVTLNNGTTIGQSPNFNIPANGKASEAVTISGYNMNLANLNTPCIATVYSAQESSISSTLSFQCTIKPNCPSGMVYYNNTSCQSTTHTCTAGYAWNGKACNVVCTAPSIYNTTTKSCWVQPKTCPLANETLEYNQTTGKAECIPQGFNWLAIGVVVVIVIVIIAIGEKKYGMKHSVVRVKK
jgi:hypothetical protein